MAMKHMDSGVWALICLARHDKAVNGSLDMVRDEKLASHSGVGHGPNATALGRRIHDGARSVHWYQSHPATQRMDAVDRIKEQYRASLVVYHQSVQLTNNEFCPEASRFLQPFYRATL